MNNRLIAALLLGVATVTMGPVACDMAATGTTAVSTPGTALGIRKEWMDTAAKPGDDWFQYANGSWLKNTEIPADRSNIGGFWIADQQTEKNLEALIAEIRKSEPEAGSEAAKVKAFYDSYLDTKSIEAAGMKPVEADLARFAAIGDKAALSQVLGSQTRAGTSDFGRLATNASSLGRKAFHRPRSAVTLSTIELRSMTRSRMA